MIVHFLELDHDALVKLTDADLNLYVDLDCADRGIPILEDSPGPRPKVDTAADITVYTVPAMEFTDQNEALAVLQFGSAGKSRVELNYMGGPGYKKSVSRAVEPAQLVVSQQFSAEAAETRKAQIAGEERAAAAWDVAKRDYDHNRHRRAEIFEKFEAKLSEARAVERRKVTLRGFYDQYLKLAEGRRAVAWNFLRAAYADAEEMVPELAPAPSEVLPMKRAYHEEETVSKDIEELI